MTSSTGSTNTPAASADELKNETDFWSDPEIQKMNAQQQMHQLEVNQQLQQEQLKQQIQKSHIPPQNPKIVRGTLDKLTPRSARRKQKKYGIRLLLMFQKIY